MRLKSIKLAGFKSFVDPTTALFPQKMTAVVGPNGCGKSNIIDAVRWVMGESSAKSLRGESMTDVIFNGSSARKPVSLASIELVFDNTDAKIGGEFARFSEIAVQRQVNRDAQSTYFLNGTRCRRKDITDLFLGTGLGARSYSIIEQGMIARLIEAKPQEMRLFIEEAAGISKYKDRRRETENRIRRTRDNLDRLTDLRDELGRQLERLSRQATAAEKYKQLKAQERQKTAELLALRWRALQQKADTAEKELGELEVLLEASVAKQRRAEAVIEEGREGQYQVQESFNQAQQQFYALGAEVARLEQSISHRRERHSELLTSLEQAQQRLLEAQQAVTEDSARKVQLEEQLTTIAPTLELSQEKEALAQEALEAAEQSSHEWQQQWDEFNHRSSEAQRRADVEQSDTRHLESAIERLSDRIGRLTREAEGLATDPLAREMDQLEEEVAACAERLGEAELNEEACQQALSSLRENNRRLHQTQETLRDQLQQAQSRRISLEALQQAAQGDDGGVSHWLTQYQLETQPRLATELDVEPGWERAVEVVLGNALHGVCVQDLTAITGWLDDFDHGKVHFFAATDDQTQAGRLSALVSGEHVPSLLQAVVAVETLEQALAMRAQLAPGESVVTRDGLWLGSDWLQVVREPEQTGILERRHELERLNEQIAVFQQRYDEVKEQLAQSREQAAEREQEREERQQQVRRIAHELSELSAAKTAREVRFEQVKMRQQRLQQEMDDAVQQREQETERLAQARGRLEVALEAMAQDVGERDRLLAARDSFRQQLETQRQQARELKDQRHHLAMEERALRTQCDALARGLTRQHEQRDLLAERVTLLTQQVEALEEPGESLGDELERKLGERLEAETAMQAVRRQLEEQEQQLRELTAQRASHEQEKQTLATKLEARRLAQQEVKVRRETLEEQLKAENYHLATLLELLPPEADEKEWQEALSQLAQRIGRLGQINLAAIDEFQQESERKAYLDQQNDDLEQALRTLEGAIHKIDRETRSRFKEYFDHINKGFQELFPKVFGGGHAYLELTGEDLLDTGVAIMARPPGKQNSTIHLLSGGEKSMVALSLIFSIFRLNPAPFCILDEVDAPLDDANVGRFCNLVREMSPLVQFIYITHNKIAMEMADTLMGVTMHEPGVSRLVAVDVEQAAEMANA